MHRIDTFAFGGRGDHCFFLNREKNFVGAQFFSVCYDGFVQTLDAFVQIVLVRTNTFGTKSFRRHIKNCVATVITQCLTRKKKFQHFAMVNRFLCPMPCVGGVVYCLVVNILYKPSAKLFCYLHLFMMMLHIKTACDSSPPMPFCSQVAKIFATSSDIHSTFEHAEKLNNLFTRLQTHFYCIFTPSHHSCLKFVLTKVSKKSCPKKNRPKLITLLVNFKNTAVPRG